MTKKRKQAADLAEQLREAADALDRVGREQDEASALDLDRDLSAEEWSELLIGVGHEWAITPSVRAVGTPWADENWERFPGHKEFTAAGKKHIRSLIRPGTLIAARRGVSDPRYYLAANPVEQAILTIGYGARMMMLRLEEKNPRLFGKLMREVVRDVVEQAVEQMAEITNDTEFPAKT